MPTRAQLDNAIGAFFAATGGVSPVLQGSSSSRYQAYEAWVFTLVLRAVKQAGGTYQILGAKSGSAPATLVFRSGPGMMGSTKQDYAYARCDVNGQQLEVHVGVRYIGPSRGTHEIDVSICKATEGSRCRSFPALFARSAAMKFAIECKCYSGTPGIELARAFVGAMSDFKSGRFKAFATNGPGKSCAGFLSVRSRPEPFFHLSPLNPPAAQRFVYSVEQELRKYTGIA